MKPRRYITGNALFAHVDGSYEASAVPWLLTTDEAVVLYVATTSAKDTVAVGKHVLHHIIFNDFGPVTTQDTGLKRDLVWPDGQRPRHTFMTLFARPRNLAAMSWALEQRS